MNKKETVSIPLNNDPIPGTLRVTANMEKVTDYKLSDKVVTEMIRKNREIIIFLLMTNAALFILCMYNYIILYK